MKNFRWAGIPAAGVACLGLAPSAVALCFALLCSLILE